MWPFASEYVLCLRSVVLRGCKRRSPLGHFPVAVRDAALGVRRPANGDLPVADVDVRMVVLALGRLGEPVDERDRLGERLELELAHERVVLLFPVVHHGTIPHHGTCKRRSDVPNSEECVNRVTEISCGVRAGVTAMRPPTCSAATGGMRGALRSRSQDGGCSRTTLRPTDSSG